MRNEETKITINGLWFFLLFVMFFAAKIFDKVDWSWWIVFSPLWGPFALIAILGLTLGIGYLFYVIYLAIMSIWK